jgi:hypothetical protein
MQFWYSVNCLHFSKHNVSLNGNISRNILNVLQSVEAQKRHFRTQRNRLIDAFFASDITATAAATVLFAKTLTSPKSPNLG